MNKTEAFLFEEYREISNLWSWTILIVLTALLLGTAILVHHLIPDSEPGWDYGAVETTPGASIYSSVSPRPDPVAPAETGKIDRQIAPRPGAHPLRMLPPSGYEMEGR